MPHDQQAEPGEMTPLVEAATHLHETYLALQAAGFTKDEALTIVARALGGHA